MSELTWRWGWNLMARLPHGRFGQVVATIAVGTVLAGGASLVVGNAPSPAPSGCPVATVGALDGPDPWGGCWPGPLTTGVPAGTTLTAYTGPTTITSPNTVIDSKIITSCLEIDTTGVVIKNSELDISGCAYAVRVLPPNTGTSITIQDSTINCQNTDTTGFGEVNTILLRLDIYQCGNGLSLAKDVTVQDSYIHDLEGFIGSDNHTDGIQFEGCLWQTGTTCSNSPAGPEGIDHTLNVTISHNTIYGYNYQGIGVPTSAIISDCCAGGENILIEKNLLAGGQFTLYCSDQTINYVVRNNHFSTVFYPNSGNVGPVISCSAEDGGGNVYHETGQPIDMSPE